VQTPSLQAILSSSEVDMGGLRRLDEQLLKLCTRIAHTVQIWTGKTNFFVAKVGLILSVLPTTLRITNYFTRILHDTTSGFALAMWIWYLLSIISLISRLDKADQKHKDSEVKVMVKDFETYSSPGLRIWILFLTCLNFQVIDQSLLDFLGSSKVCICGLLVFLYFVSVDPLTPRKSKIREWVEGFSFGTLAPARVGSNG
jgi:hypothetical protein